MLTRPEPPLARRPRLRLDDHCVERPEVIEIYPTSSRGHVAHRPSPSGQSPKGLRAARILDPAPQAYPFFTMQRSPLGTPSRNERSSITDDWIGGASRNRTDDLKLAKLALSQLSYGPDPTGFADARSVPSDPPEQVVGLGRFELPTSRLSSARSNQLSYRPVSVHPCEERET